MKYFELDEFDSPDAPGSGSKMDKHFLNVLERMREAAGIPFRITSGYRTAEHNKLAGGKANSAHLRGFAADISAATGQKRFLIVEAALASGIKRIGIAKTFIHVDIDASLPSRTVWLY